MFELNKRLIKFFIVIFLLPAATLCASSVASHTCAPCSLLSIDKNVQVCDATDDAQRFIAGLIKNFALFIHIVLHSLRKNYLP